MAFSRGGINSQVRPRTKCVEPKSKGQWYLGSYGVDLRWYGRCTCATNNSPTAEAATSSTASASASTSTNRAKSHTSSGVKHPRRFLCIQALERTFSPSIRRKGGMGTLITRGGHLALINSSGRGMSSWIIAQLATGQ